MSDKSDVWPCGSLALISNKGQHTSEAQFHHEESRWQLQR